MIFASGPGDRSCSVSGDDQRNGALTPQTVSYGSRVQVWWHCDKGHQWQSAVFSRTGSHSRCPYCAGVRAWPEKQTWHLGIRSWPASGAPKNQGLTPNEVLPGSHKMVWWRCEKGHQWPGYGKNPVWPARAVLSVPIKRCVLDTTI